MDFKAFQKLEKVVEKMYTHAESEIHIQSCEAEMVADRVLQAGTIVQQLQQIGDEEKVKNRSAVKALIHCTQFIVRCHVAHTTNFDYFVDLVVCCGVDDKEFPLKCWKVCKLHVQSSCC